MGRLKTPVQIDTAFDTYQVTDLLGEGGAGRVYAGNDGAGKPVAIKILTSSSTDKKRRFKNEIGFLAGNRHANIVIASDHGIGTIGSATGPFYVMSRFECSLRTIVLRKPTPDVVTNLFSQIINGVEAAHLKGVVHRDLKPENVLINDGGKHAAVSDFGIASFTEDMCHTLVETGPGTRLANFVYAAPEQRNPGQPTGVSTDIYALGLMLNELFTGQVPHGTDYQSISAVASDFGFLDPIVERMLRQNPTERPQSIAALKGLIERHRSDFVSQQKLSALEREVVPFDEIDDPLALVAPKLTGANWNNGTLRLTLDKHVHRDWLEALHNMDTYTSFTGIVPQCFGLEGFSSDTLTVRTSENDAQQFVDVLKGWLPKPTQVLAHNIRQKLDQDRSEHLDYLRQQREVEERNIRVNASLRV